jgi:ferric-dicitrate binding protein FerR (iron transport regulator)
MPDESRSKRERIGYLLARRQVSVLTETEAQELEQFCQEQPGLRKVMERMDDEEALGQMLAYRKRAEERKGLHLRPESDPGRETQPKSTGRIIKIVAAVAAAVVIVLVTGYIWSSKDRPGTISNPVTRTEQLHSSPGGSRNAIVMPDGEKIPLSPTTKGMIVSKEDVVITQDDSNHIKWDNNGSTDPASRGISHPVGMARLETSPDGLYGITLPDGSKVWLNRSSSLKFPSAFNGSAREVEMTGEAYFEVAKNTEQPFIIRNIGQLKDVNIEVLGTSFNVTAYSDTQGIRTTVINGKIRVTQRGQKKELSAREQLTIRPDEKWAVQKEANTDEVLSWQKDRIIFYKDSLRVALQKLADCFKVQLVIVPPALTGQPVTGSLPRNMGLQGLLEFVSRKKTVFKYKLENNKMIIDQ